MRSSNCRHVVGSSSPGEGWACLAEINHPFNFTFTCVKTVKYMYHMSQWCMTTPTDAMWPPTVVEMV